MDNKAIAGILYETADLLEIDGQDSFRIRSYRNAAQAIEALPQQISVIISEPKRVLEIPGIGKGMLLNAKRRKLSSISGIFLALKKSPQPDRYAAAEKLWAISTSWLQEGLVVMTQSGKS